MISIITALLLSQYPTVSSEPQDPPEIATGQSTVATRPAESMAVAQPAGPAASVRVEPVQPEKPDLAIHAPIYVASTEQLVAETASDPIVGNMAVDLHERRRTATVIGLTGIIGGAALTGLAYSRALETCSPANNYSLETCSSNAQLAWVGAGISSAAFLMWLIMTPHPGDYYAVLNAWNARHPQYPLAR